MFEMTREEKASNIRRLMDAEGAAVARNTRGFNAGRYASVGRLGNYETLKSEARAIKERAIDQLPELIEQLRERIEKFGGVMYLAEDAADANQYIAEVAEGAERLVKSKSMTSEEIEVNEHLEAAGIEVVETDLGEWVLQVAEEDPSHIVAPAIHKSREAIAGLFDRHFQPDEPLKTAEELTRFARRKLGSLIKGADIGMTGANFLTADTGTIALVTSEGNARKTALVPPTYIAVAGVDKIIPTIEDLQPFTELIGRSGTGQDITSYISLLTPPFASPPINFDHPAQPITPAERSFHLVLIDNGRLAMREDPHLKETLYCIRCGACSNVCANFQQVGGHAFGGQTYSGGIGTGWEAGVHGLDSAERFNELCTGCSRCVEACPVKIDIPWINVVVRDRINSKTDSQFDWLVDGLRPSLDGGNIDLQKHLVARFGMLAKLGSQAAPLSNWIANLKPVRMLMEQIFGIDRRRALPAFKRETLRKWFDRRPKSDSRREDNTVLVPDPYTNYVLPERGIAAVRVLEALGARVCIPDVPSSGRAPLSQGMIQSAEQRARSVWTTLVDYVDAGHDIIVIEPSDLAMYRWDYKKLLSKKAYESLRDQSFELMEYINRLLQDGADTDALTHGEGRRIAYHSHCQQRTLKLAAPTVSVLRTLGYDVWTTDVECCGMAGSFGYKKEYYELSMKVGQELDEQLASEDAARTVVASGTSCQEQIGALINQPVAHPIEVIAPDGY